MDTTYRDNEPASKYNFHLTFIPPPNSGQLSKSSLETLIAKLGEEMYAERAEYRVYGDGTFAVIKLFYPHSESSLSARLAELRSFGVLVGKTTIARVA